MKNPTRNTHPMLIVAATSVTLASLAATAFFAGWVPGSTTTTAHATQSMTSVPAKSAVSSSPRSQSPAAEKSAQQRTLPQARTSSSPTAQDSRPDVIGREISPVYSQRGATPVSTYPINDSGIQVESGAQLPRFAQNQYPQQSASCRDCATIESIREIKQDGEGTGLGAIAGGVLGGLLGNQVGGGRGKTVGAVVGAAGGAYAGHQIEKNVRSNTAYEITVRLDDGATRILKESQPPSFQRGDRVRITNGQLTPM